MRPIDTIDVEDVRALPRLRCVRCPARVAVRTHVRNLTPKAREVALTLRVRGPGLDERIELKPQKLAPRTRREIGTRVDIERPRLWQPGSPCSTRCRPPRTRSSAPKTARDARRSRARARGTYRLSFGVRKLETPARRALPERPPAAAARREHPRGRHRGPAPRSRRPRARTWCAGSWTSAPRSRARTTRSTPPSSRPSTGSGSSTGRRRRSTSCRTRFFDLPAVRGSATRAVRLTVENNLNHPSIFAWSLVNEPAGSRLGARPDRPGARDLHPRGAPPRRARSTTRA